MLARFSELPYFTLFCVSLIPIFPTVNKSNLLLKNKWLDINTTRYFLCSTYFSIILLHFIIIYYYDHSLNFAPIGSPNFLSYHSTSNYLCTWGQVYSRYSVYSYKTDRYIPQSLVTMYGAKYKHKNFYITKYMPNDELVSWFGSFHIRSFM